MCLVAEREEGPKFLVWFGLMLNVPVNNFSVMLGRSHRFLGITITFLGKNVFLKDTTWQLGPKCLNTVLIVFICVWKGNFIQYAKLNIYIFLYFI